MAIFCNYLNVGSSYFRFLVVCTFTPLNLSTVYTKTADTLFTSFADFSRLPGLVSVYHEYERSLSYNIVHNKRFTLHYQDMYMHVNFDMVTIILLLVYMDF